MRSKTLPGSRSENAALALASASSAVVPPVSGPAVMINVNLFYCISWDIKFHLLPSSRELYLADCAKIV